MIKITAYLLFVSSISLAACGGGGSREWHECVSDMRLSIKNPDDYWRAGAACEIQFRKEGKMKLMPSKTQENRNLDYLNDCLAKRTCSRY